MVIYKHDKWLEYRKLTFVQGILMSRGLLLAVMWAGERFFFIGRIRCGMGMNGTERALPYIRVCLKNSLIRNFGVFCAISASSTLDLALLSLRVSSLNWRKIHSNLRIFLFKTHSRPVQLPLAFWFGLNSGIWSFALNKSPRTYRLCSWASYLYSLVFLQCACPLLEVAIVIPGIPQICDGLIDD